MSGRYELYRVDRIHGAPTTLLQLDDLDGLLRRRDDDQRANDPKQVHFGIFDTDDPERGDADWCSVCSAHGAFGGDGYCDLCEQGIEAEEEAAK